MTFRKLSEFFQKLESTSSRNAMIEILAELFAEAGVNEIDKIAYLLQGRVAPLYEPIEFGMAEKMIIKAIAKGTGSSEQGIIKEFKKTGDLGIVAERLALSVKRKVESQTVGAVFEKLYAITQTAGVGSVEKKIELLANLLKESDPLSARYIARIPVDKLRLGFSDMTILDALSWMIDETKKHKDLIEAAYNIRPDLGTLAVSVRWSGVSGMRNIGPKVGTPILVMRAERLTSASAILEKTGGKCAVEPKLDGFRLQLHFSLSNQSKSKKGPEIRLFSRGLEHVTAMYPDIVEAAGKELRVSEVILDGEAIGFNPKTGKYLPFQETVQRKRKYGIEEFSKNVPLKYVVFDCLYLNGESLIDKPYSERRKEIERLLGSKAGSNTIIPAEMHVVSETKALEKLFGEMVKDGLEGIMAKKLEGVYQAGARGWNWIKLKGSYIASGEKGKSKLADTVDAVVMGYDFGQGKRSSFGVGAFLVGVYDQKTDSFKTISKVGTGLTDEEWRELAVSGKRLAVSNKPRNYDVNKVMDCDVWVKPRLVGEFLADEITRSPMHTAGYALRFPRLVQWREKKPEDTTSLKEIFEMVKLQVKS